MMVSIECTNKLSLDKPTFIWHIPTEKLGFDNTTAAAADYCLRVFATYIDALNAELYNRSRPDNENGKYYLYRPKGEVLIRNAAYFAHCPQRTTKTAMEIPFICSTAVFRCRRKCAYVYECRYSYQKTNYGKPSKCSAMTYRKQWICLSLDLI